MGRPVFYFDLSSPEAYLAAERVNHVLGEVPVWEPVLLGELGAGGFGGFRCAEEEQIFRAHVERRVSARGLMPVRWPDPFPADSEWAMLVAAYCRHIGRVVAFSLAAFRQAFAAGRDLGRRENVLIAAAACELHPAAVIKGAELSPNVRRLRDATRAAAEAGVRAVPALRVGERIFHGDDQLEAAAAALSAEAVA